MKISELMKKLREIKKENGDVPVFINVDFYKFTAQSEIEWVSFGKVAKIDSNSQDGKLILTEGVIIR